MYSEFKDRYSIIKEQSGFKLKIINIRHWDQGRFFCRVTYDAKPSVKMRHFLIVKERGSSSLINFSKATVVFCMIVTCIANSSQVKLKRPENIVITGQHIVLDSCNSSLTNGEYSCCLLDECSRGECKHLTLEVNNRIVPNIIISLLLVAIIVVAAPFILRIRRKYKQNQTDSTPQEQQTILKKITDQFIKCRKLT